jgi:hypothetical protein
MSHTSVFSILVAALLFNHASAQSIEAMQDSIAYYQQIIAKAESDEGRMDASKKCKSFVQEALDMPEAFSFPFEELTTMCTLSSPDGAFRLFNWNVPKNDQTHEYVCFVLFPASDRKAASWIELKELKRQPDKLQSRSFDENEWLGCLYYGIIPPAKKGRDFYTLLAWDGRDRMTNRKIVDAVDIKNRGFKSGKAVFKTEKGVQKRLIFEYSDEASMSLRYHEKDDRIVYDHLSPRQAGMEGNYAFYGPDLTYDAMKWQKNNWVEQTNIDIRLDEERDSRPYNDPRPRRN